MFSRTSKTYAFLITAFFAVACSTNSNSDQEYSSDSESATEQEMVQVEGVYSGTDNVGMESTIVLRAGGSLAIQASVGDGTPSYGSWSGSADNVSLYQTDDFGNEQLIANARISSDGLQIIGGNFYARQ